jgi:hypothetical protein
MGLETLALAAGASAGTASTIGTIGTIASIGSTVMSTIGGIQQGNAASAAAGYNAKIAAQNAELQRQNAAFAGAQGEQNVAAAQAENKAKLAAIEAEQGASGVDINSKSSSQVRQSASKLGMLNALNIRSEAARKAYGFQTDAVNSDAESRLSKAQGKSAKIGGYLNAGATVLGGVGKAVDSYQDYLGKTDNVGLTSTFDAYGNNV